MDQLRLLIVESDAADRRAIATALAQHFGRGTATTVRSLAAALEQPLSLFDLILTDYYLPDASGRDVLEAIAHVCSTPVIVVTSEIRTVFAKRAIRHGAMDYIVKTGEYVTTLPLVVEKNLTIAKIRRENETLHFQLERALRDLGRKNAELEESLHRVEELAATDALTGLYNRRHFARVSEQMFAEAYRYDQDLACIMIDLDGFKQVNDTCGHQMGDAVLSLAGRVINACLRKMDVAARYGGDEFVILLPQSGIEQAQIVAERIREEFNFAAAKELHAHLHGRAKVSMSLGIATVKDTNAANEENLLASADTAMYQAKKQGKDRIACGSGLLNKDCLINDRSDLHA